jgi:hypothetical protein
MNMTFLFLLFLTPPLPCHLLYPIKQKEKGEGKTKKNSKNLKCVLISAAGMADSLRTVACVFSDKRVLFINSVPF